MYKLIEVVDGKEYESGTFNSHTDAYNVVRTAIGRQGFTMNLNLILKFDETKDSWVISFGNNQHYFLIKNENGGR